MVMTAEEVRKAVAAGLACPVCRETLQSVSPERLVQLLGVPDAFRVALGMAIRKLTLYTGICPDCQGLFALKRQ